MSSERGMLGEERSDAAASGDSFALQYLGYGFFWAWAWILFFSSVLLSSQTHGLSAIAGIGTSVPGVEALALLLMSLFADRASGPKGRRAMLLGACILGPLSTLAIAFGSQLDGTAWLTVSLSGMAGLGIVAACMNWLWGTLYSTMDLNRATVYMSGSVALGACVYLGVTYMQSGAALVVASLLPVVSASMVLLASRGHRSSPAESRRDRRPTPTFLWRLLLAVAIYAAVFGVLQGITAVKDAQVFDVSNRYRLLGSGLVGLSIAVGTLTLARTRRISRTYRMVLPTMVAGLLLLPFLGGDRRAFAGVLVAVGFQCFDIVTWLASFDVARRLGLSPVKVFGFGRAANAGGVCVGGLVMLAVGSAVTMSQSVMTALALAAVFLLVVTSTLVLDESVLFSGKDTAARPEPLAGGEGYSGSWRQRCERVANDHGLTPREQEVMILLAKGRDAEYIQNALVISNHTVKTHRCHIYSKLDIHSQQELLDLIEGYKSPDST